MECRTAEACGLADSTGIGLQENQLHCLCQGRDDGIRQLSGLFGPILSRGWISLDEDRGHVQSPRRCNIRDGVADHHAVSR